MQINSDKKINFEKPYRPTWLIITLTLQSLLISYLIYATHNIFGYIYLDEELFWKEINNLTTFTFLVFGVLILINLLFWFYSIISVLKNDFKKDINKICWLVTLFLAPFFWMLYLDFEEIQIIKKG